LADGYHIDPKNDNCAVDNELRKARNHIKKECNWFIRWVGQVILFTKQNKQSNQQNKCFL